MKEKLNYKELGADCFRKEAEEGNAEAQYRLGKCYALGYGVGKDYITAVEWFRNAAKQGNAGGINGLGVCYLQGNGVSQDYAKAYELFCKATEQGNAAAQFNLGRMYANGRGIEKDEAQAVEWYRKAAERGHAKAQVNLGVMYANGRGVKKDEAQAVEWYRKAAEQGYARAEVNLGGMYANGRGVEKDEARAVEWYRKAADQGHADAQYNLGWMYESGSGVEKDEVQAVAWYRKAAEQGQAVAQYFLGRMYANGSGVEKDKVQAVAWYRKAAEQGQVAAQYFLGRMYANGSGVVKDEVQAVAWYRKAAEQGYVDAQRRLGDCYENGKGVKKDLEEAKKWYFRAAKQGDVYAKIAKAALDSGISEPAQLLREGKVDKIFWPEVEKHNVTYALSTQVPKVFKKFGYCMDYQTGSISGCFPDIDGDEWLQGMLEKLYYELYGTRQCYSDIELVFARESTGDDDVRFYAWDEHEDDFVRLLKDNPSVCPATFNERFARDILHVQRQLNEKYTPVFFFSREFTRLVGMRKLEDLIFEAKRGNVYDFLRNQIIPVMKGTFWEKYYNQIILRVPYLTAYGETGCKCWNCASSDFSGYATAQDDWIDVLWAGGELMQDKNIYCVFVPESIAYVIMRAISSKDNEMGI